MSIGPEAVLLSLLGLGALHGINPAMGWLFAVALGMQERRGRAVWRALGPLALGHALAIGLAVAAGLLLGALIPLGALKWAVAIVLAGYGVRRLFRHGHPRYGGMRVGARQLTIWSFLMATAHGAGLMVLPFVIGSGVRGGDAGHAGHTAGVMTTASASGSAGMAMADDQLLGLGLTLVHTAGYLLVTGLLAVVVYEKVGLKVLRSAWINLDLIWSIALIATAVATLLW